MRRRKSRGQCSYLRLAKSEEVLEESLSCRKAVYRKETVKK